MGATIRPYQVSDKNALLSIFSKNVPKYFDPTELHDFEKYLEEKPDTYLTVEYNQTIVGGSGFEANEDKQTGSITWIFFDPQHTGKGLGKLAVDHSLTELKKNPVVKKLIVRTSQLAYVFFEKFGFQLMTMETDYWGEGLDLYEMEMIADW